MKAGGFTLGGEQSGHVIMLDHATTGDGMLTALHLLARVAATGKPLAELAGGDGPAAAGAGQRHGRRPGRGQRLRAAAGRGRRGRGRAGRHRPGAAAPERHRAGGAGDGRGRRRRRRPRRSPRGWPTSCAPSSPSGRPADPPARADVRPIGPGDKRCADASGAGRSCGRGVRYRVGKARARPCVRREPGAPCRTVGVRRGHEGSARCRTRSRGGLRRRRAGDDASWSTPRGRARRGATAAAGQGASPATGLALAAAVASPPAGEPTWTPTSTPSRRSRSGTSSPGSSGLGPGAPSASAGVHARTGSSRGRTLRHRLDRSATAAAGAGTVPRCGAGLPVGQRVEDRPRRGVARSPRVRRGGRARAARYTSVTTPRLPTGRRHLVAVAEVGSFTPGIRKRPNGPIRRGARRRTPPAPPWHRPSPRSGASTGWTDRGRRRCCIESARLPARDAGACSGVYGASGDELGASVVRVYSPSSRPGSPATCRITTPETSRRNQKARPRSSAYVSAEPRRTAGEPDGGRCSPTSDRCRRRRHACRRSACSPNSSDDGWAARTRDRRPPAAPDGGRRPSSRATDRAATEQLVLQRLRSRSEVQAPGVQVPTPACSPSPTATTSLARSVNILVLGLR